jgi:hypothetical protein
MDFQGELRELLLGEVPLRFWESMAKGAPVLYKEAYSRAYKETAWGEPEAKYMLPHHRRSFFEYLFRTSALTAGLIAVSEPNFAGNCEYTLVRAGRLVFTASHVDGENEVVRPSLFRKQNAIVNRILSNPTLKAENSDEVIFNPPKLYEADEISAIITHGAISNDPSTFGFVRVVFPSADSTKYVANFDMFEIYTISLNRAQAKAQADVVDIAIPKLRKKKKGESDNE